MPGSKNSPGRCGAAASLLTVRRAMRCCIKSGTLGSVSPAAVEKAFITWRAGGRAGHGRGLGLQLSAANPT